jgi:hypothetical protein
MHDRAFFTDFAVHCQAGPAISVSTWIDYKTEVVKNYPFCPQAFWCRATVLPASRKFRLAVIDSRAQFLRAPGFSKP